MPRPVLAVALLGLLIGATSARAAPRPVADGHAAVELVADVTAAPAGDAFTVGVRFTLQPGWHVYWKNPGQAGFATELAYQGGAEVGPIRWPAPERFATSDGFIVTYGYAREVILPSPATQRAGGRLEVAIDALICEVDCIPVSETLAIDVPLGARAASAEAPALAAALAREPRRADPAITSVRVSPSPLAPGDALEVTITQRTASATCLAAPRVEGGHVLAFPERVASLDLAPQRAEAACDTWTVVLAGRAGPDPQPDQVLPIVVELVDGSAITVDAPIARTASPGGATTAPTADGATPGAAATPAATPVTAPAPPAAPPFALLLLFAFVGGLLLNLMPCVLPVLAIKVTAIARLGGASRRDVALHGAAYAGGIVTTMLALAALVIGLRAAGTQVGWGFQFQEPLFGALVGALLVALALSAFGVFHVGLIGGGAAATVDAQPGLRRSFGEGILAVLLATPCSAPYLGSAVGVALASPAPVILAVFGVLGLGLAAPLVLLLLVPGARRLLPRPGGWMVALERVSGLALLGAALWLAWIVGRTAGVDGMAATLAFWLVVGAAAWAFGVAQAGGSRARRLGVLIGAALVLVVAGRWLLAFTPSAAARVVDDRAAAWRPWSDAAVRAELAAGRAVFVDFTADWCVTCKANERLVIHTDATRAELAALDVATFVADWTRPDEAIRAALAAQGKAGVPMYLVYAPGAPGAPTVLPELLTRELLIQALRTAAASSPKE